jgi:putative ABC transport system ATP-binding protein
MGKNKLDVLKGINLEIKKGDFVAILGPSGSGKSTLMNQVGILDTPSKGEVYLNGKAISKLEESDLAQIRGRTIGFVFQQFNLIPTLTALENVTLPTIFQDMPEEKRIARGTELLTNVGLGDRLHHKPTELSGGQQQRVAISRALVNDPDIILADEPTGNLDSESGRQVMNMLHDLNKKEGKTIILVTHDIHLVKEAQKIIMIKDGVIVGKKRRK